MSNLETIGTKEKWTERQVNYNKTSKTLARVVGANISLFVCLMLPFVLIGFMWTDFVAFTIDRRFLSDGIVTVSLFIIGELLMMRVGASGGKLDDEYIAAKKEYDELVRKVHDVGTMFLSMFCDWQVDTEMTNAITVRVRSLRMTTDEWLNAKGMTPDELREKYGWRKAQKILNIINLDPVDLNDAMLLYNGNDALSRGGIPISGEAYIEKKSHSAQTILSAIFTGLLTVTVALAIASDMSFAKVMYTLFKCIVLLSRMAQGYAVGAKAYNTVEVRQLLAKCNYLRLYIRFVNDKTYLKLGSEYGDVSCYVNDEPTDEKEDSTTFTEQTTTNDK